MNQQTRIIRLTELLKQNKRQIKKESIELGQGKAKLDCRDCNIIPDHKIKIIRYLFSGIPTNWQNHNELENFIVMETLEIDVHRQITKYLSSRFEKNNVLDKWYIILPSVLASVVVLFIVIKYIEFLVKPKVSLNSIKIGSLWKPEEYTPLADYLKSQLIPNNFFKFIAGKQVTIINEGDKTLKYQVAKQRITQKEWDIAFTLSPVLSVTAKDSGYTFVARMFPDKPSYYRSAIFVKPDSPIKSLSDLKPTTVIAMGDFNSASSFYVPVYDLFGRTLTVKMGFRGQEIREMVTEGKADVGVGAFGDIVQNNTDVRIIHLSRKIPGSNVYLSPNLSVSDRSTIEQVLLNTPTEIKKKANYGLDKEVDYSSFIGIIQKTEKVVECSDFTKNPVNFYCSPNTEVSKQIKPTIINAKVNGFSYLRSNIVRLTLEDKDSRIYRLAIFTNLLDQASNKMSLLDIQDKQIQVIDVIPKRLPDDSFEIIVTQPEKVKIID